MKKSRVKLRLSKQEFSEYKAMSLDEKLKFIRARAKAKSKESVRRVSEKPIRMLPIFVAIIGLAFWGYSSHLASVLGLENMNEYIYCNNCRTYHRAEHTLRYQVGDFGAFELDLCCPSCKSTDLEEANICFFCETPTTNSVLCDECLGEFGVYYKEFVKKVTDRWNFVTKGDVAELVEDLASDI